MKNILGLDLGTNSIGWALVQQDFKRKQGEILGLGSRIIPMSQDILDNFGAGKPSKTQTSERTGYRGVRRLRERHLLRRERLHRVLNILNFLPSHYAHQIDFEKRLGQFVSESEPKLVYDNKEFVFKKSFEEMLEDFKENQPQLLINTYGEPALVPYDWTIYYLRKKALTQKIDKQELAWIILNFNQKRGYYQLRGEEEEEDSNKLVEFYSLKVIDVIPDEVPSKKGETWYSLLLENGWTYRRSSKVPLYDWKDKTRDFIVTTDINDNGSIKLDKDGNEKRSFRAPKEDDWGLVKKKSEQEIEQSGKTVGAYIYETLLENPKQKIKGKLVRTIERKFYKEELHSILKKQIELQPELFTEDLYAECVRELYRNNESHQLTLSNKGFLHLLLEDIIFYQRPLRSQKSSISNCSLEFREYKIDGIEKQEYLKAIPKSNPYYQEFRVWQWLYNLKIYKDDIDVTNDFLNDINDLENFFEFLMNQKEVDHKDVLKYFHKDLKGKALNAEIAQYRWNYVFDLEKGESKKYPMNETRYEINRRFKKCNGYSADFLKIIDEKEILIKKTKERKVVSLDTREYQLWHIIYSVTDKKEFEQALNSFAEKHGIDKESFVENFRKIPPYKSEYGTYSEKAIKKILPLMRIGKYWNWEAIDNKTKTRIDNIINAVEDEIRLIVREKAEKHQLKSENDFQGLPLWLAQYIVYDRHSEADIAGKWNSIVDLEKYLEDFKQHSLRNPIVEQVVTETIRVVKDIWIKYGNGKKGFFDEIHIELAREMKNTTDERKRLSNIISDNENTNRRIKALLIEMMNDSNVENVRPYSPMQQEILKIYEDGVLSSTYEIEDEILKISKKAEPSKAELQRYKLWLEQKYRSPYTGETIPLNKLFTSEYEIEHVIPQSRFFDDSFTNKVICEAAVNKLKDNQLAFEFIKNHYGRKVPVGNGKHVEVFSEEQYKEFVEKNYSKNRKKKDKLLLEEIPEKMVERQLNDTRYISKLISNILSNIVRSDRDDEGVNSKNVIPGNGKITNILKQDWGLNDVWNDLILPRFERMNQITKTDLFTTYNKKHQKYLPAVPFEYSKGFKKKRIDHRHHALDALVIACATRDYVNLLNNQSAKSDLKRYDLQNKLRRKESYFNKKENKQKEAFKEFVKPWDSFTVDAKEALDTVVVSFKQNLRVINKATNKHEKWVDKNGEKKKEIVEQKGTNWAIRKPMHKETVSGMVNLSRIKVPKNKVLTATRKSLDTSFNLKTIESITDTGIIKILKNYLYSKEGNSELAFSPEGIEDMNKNIESYNDGKPHQPIYKVRVFEVGTKFPLGQTGNKKDKYVEAAKGTNLFFAVYWNEQKQKRTYETIPLNEVIDHQQWRASLTKEESEPIPTVPIKPENGNYLFSLSPNDLVYVPMEHEEASSINFDILTKEHSSRIYRFTDSSGTTGNFVSANISSVIFNFSKKEQEKIGLLLPVQNELGVGSPQSKNQKSFDDIMIKDRCIKLKVDRLGNLSKV